MVLRLVIIFASLFFCFACFGESPPNERFKTKKPPIDTLSFAMALQDHLNVNDIDYILSHFDRNTYTKRTISATIANMDIDRAQEKSFILSLRQNLSPMMEVIPSVIEGLIEGIDHWEFASYRRYKKRETLLFRVDIEDVVGYMEFEIADERIIDVYTHSTETWLSQILGNTAAILTKAKTGKQSTTPFFFAARAEGSDVVELFRRLPSDEKRSHFAQSMLVGVASKRDTTTFLNAMQELLKVAAKERFTYPKYSYYYSIGDTQLALQEIRAFQKRIGGDLQAKLFEVELLQELGEYKRAYSELYNTIKNHPNEEISYYMAMVVLVSQNRYYDAVLALDVLTRDLGVELNYDALAAYDETSEFVKSQAFLDWKAEISRELRQ